MNPKQDPRKKEALPKERRSLPEWLAVKLDIPADAAGDGLRLDMRGCEFVTILRLALRLSALL